MPTTEDSFYAQLRITFKHEADEHLQEIVRSLLELEKSPVKATRVLLIESAYRAAHSLKGAARAVDYLDIESLCESMEDLFAAAKDSQDEMSSSDLQSAHQTVDMIMALLASSPDTFTAPLARESLQETNTRGQVSAAPLAPQAAPDMTLARSAVRVPVAALDAHLRETEEILAVKFAAGQHLTELRDLSRRIEECWNVWMELEQELRLSRTRATSREDNTGSENPPLGERLPDLLISGREILKELERRVTAMVRTARQDELSVGQLLDDLIDGATRLLQLPFSSIAATFPKLVRDLCHSQNKKAELTIRGGDTEIDKRIIDELKDPLVHLLRNSVDHGVAPPADRVAQGKPSSASVVLSVSRIAGGKVQLVLSDDGNGIDLRAVKSSAVKHGVIGLEEAAHLDDDSARAFIFQSAVTTRDTVTKVSGRGLGLAIVREKIEGLGGEIAIESETGQGTTFRIVVPTVRTVMRGVLVEVQGQVFAVLATLVTKVLRVGPADFKTIEDRETIPVDNCCVPIVQLAEILELPTLMRCSSPHNGATVLVLGEGEKRIAFSVDAVLGEQELLIKGFRRPLVRVRNVAAVTVLSNGTLAPILHVRDLLKSARKFLRATVRASPEGRNTPYTAQHSILIAEDSITTRTLLKTALEAAGYHVNTAVDGLDAFDRVTSGNFDLVVSDVEMPRLNGFDLTSRIRADHRLAETPVVLVTALDTQEDRVRGIDVGASAYVTKSNFDQSNLISIIQQLIGRAVTT